MEKQEIKTKNMHELSQYRKYLYKHPRLKCLFIELTDKCNLHCRHCGSSCKVGNEHFIDTALIIKTIETIARDFSNTDFMICLTGGEPLLHPDFEKIVTKINECDIPWGMTSNATLIDENMAKKLIDLKMRSISISLDGLKENHEWLRQAKGSFHKTIFGIKSLKQLGFPVQVTSVINKHNFHELNEMYFLMKRLKVDSWRVINVDPIGRANDEGGLLLSKEEIRQLLEFIRAKRFDNSNYMDVTYGCSHYVSYELENEIRDNYFLCTSGIYIASILVNGDIYGCLDIERRPELVQGNICNDNFHDAWINRFKEYRFDRSNKCNQCKKCSEKEFCAGDSMHTWDFDNDRPLLCLKEVF